MTGPSALPGATVTQGLDLLSRAMLPFWHPVCTVSELNDRNPLPVTLLERKLVVARLDDRTFVAMDARCPHRSASLACGKVDGAGIRCAYHGWRFGADGRCVDIPALPDGPVPGRAAVQAYDTAEAYSIVWVRLLRDAATVIPACPPYGRPGVHVVEGAPYTWPVGAHRRVENFVDLSHFAFVHDGTLGRRDEPVPPIPEIERAGGELRFVYDPPSMTVDTSALFGRSSYRMPMPCTVSIEFELASGANRYLWMTASPTTRATCRVFWMHARDDDLDGDDQPYVDFQALVLDEDEPVVSSQDPPDLPLDPAVELSLRTDKVSIEYRRWLRELADQCEGAGV
ncbi:MAG: Rieske 2Fe-2S domain-containing protein [Acidimicrobiia bacterium]